MAYTLKDRVLVTSTSTGTGDFSLGAAVTGYQAFTVVGNGAQIPYTIQGLNPDGSQTGDWEVGIGTWYSAGNYITRDTVLESSNSGSKVAFPSGDKNVFLDLPGELVVQGPDSATASDFVAFDGTSGKIIKDSGYSSASFATAAQGAKADTAVQTSQVGVANGVASLDSTGKVPTSQIPQMGDLNYQGTWNAATNTPTLTSSVGTKGYYYVVSVSGSTNLDGITDWVVGDWAVFNGSVWQKIDNTDAVTSVNGYTGAVVLTQPDIAGTVPTSRTISTGTGLIGGGDLSANRTISFSTASVGTWAANPTSANLSAAMTDETGSGSLVFNTSPLLVTPTLSGATVDNAAPYIDFANGSAVTLAAGRMWYDGSTGSWNLGMGGGNITQQVGEEQFIYGKASAAITEGQLIVKTGANGASGVITFAPSPANLTDNDGIIGVATENIALNGFGRITTFGVVHGINTSGSSVGETWADGDTLWYNPAGSGKLTNVKPTAPNIKFAIATVTHAGPGGSGSIQVDLQPGSVLGGTDANVQMSTPSNGQILTYDGTNTYWKNTSLTAGTAISVTSSATGVLTIANTAPDQTVSITGAGGAVVTGTYPNFTITTPSGTVTSVTATAPLASTGGATPNLTITQAGAATNGYLSSTDWNTFNNKGSGSVTSVSGTGTVNGITLTGTVTSSGNLTLGGTLSNVSLTSQVTGTLPIANGGTNATSAGAAIANLFGFTSTATAAGTTALTNTSTFFQLFTGTTTQTVTLPVVSTLAQGWRFNIVNTSTGTVTVNSSGGNLVYAIPTNGAITVACIATTGTTAAAWVLADSTTAVWNA